MLRRAIALLITGLVFSLAASAQYRRPEPRKTPRALGVLEIDKQGKARLFPVTIIVEGKIYDASLYVSKPAPMALWSETVYEGQKSGMPMGLFTVNTAARLGDLWFGLGDWKSFADSGTSKKKDSTKPEKAKSAPKLKDDNDEERPVLKKPTSEANPAPSDAQKPVEAPKQAPPQSVATPSGPDDADRPTLRRGKPAEGSQVKDDEPFKILDPKKDKVFTSDVAETYLAISDSGPSDNRPYDMQLSPDEQANYGDQLTKLAWAEVRKFASGRATIPSNAVFSNVRIRSFDLDYSNNPLFVYSAEYETALDQKLPSGAAAQRSLTYYVTYVGRGDMNGRVMKVFTITTDSMHLDAYARMELIDAVDADADGRGELLFREIDDIGRKYVLYRASPYWAQLFEGASGQ